MHPSDKEGDKSLSPQSWTIHQEMLKEYQAEIWDVEAV
jgi:hypothetical protein